LNKKAAARKLLLKRHFFSEYLDIVLFILAFSSLTEKW